MASPHWTVVLGSETGWLSNQIDVVRGYPVPYSAVQYYAHMRSLAFAVWYYASCSSQVAPEPSL
jgi:hypothetical protein